MLHNGKWCVLSSEIARLSVLRNIAFFPFAQIAHNAIMCVFYHYVRITDIATFFFSSATLTNPRLPFVHWHDSILLLWK